MNKHFSIELPEWVAPFLDNWHLPMKSAKQRMELAVALSAENVRQKTGGPFAALVVDEDSLQLVSVGLNLVTTSGLSVAHAEMVALSLAQAYKGEWSLAKTGSMQLITTCEPCAMCFGAVPWSGVKSVVSGAGKSDAEAAGFDEGDKPDNWVRSLQQRGIVVQTGVLRKQAAQVLADYKTSGGTIYNAKPTNR
jgi:tRNA(Arg) A34 adenosine deaminase TadA